MGKRAVLGEQIQFCDATYAPSPVYIPVEIEPDRPTDGIKPSRHFFYVCDYAVAKRIARNPDDVDVACGMDVPVAPPLTSIDHMPHHTAGARSLRDYLNEVHRLWTDAAAQGYQYTAFITHPGGYAMEVRLASNGDKLAYAHSHTVYSMIRQDEAIVMHYNTPADGHAAAANAPRNDAGVALLEAANCADLPIGSFLLERRSLRHQVPLGLTGQILRAAFRDNAPNANLPTRRRRTQNAQQARKRRRRLEQALESEGVTPNDDECLLMRITSDPMNPYKAVIVARDKWEDQCRQLVGWQGSLREDTVPGLGDREHEVVVIAPFIGDPDEVTHRRTMPAEAYTVNIQAQRLFHALPGATTFSGPVLVAMRNKAKGTYVHFGERSFRDCMFGNGGAPRGVVP